jgi:hypothetical protein
MGGYTDPREGAGRECRNCRGGNPRGGAGNLWTLQRDVDRFRIQGGVRFGFEWFANGQTIEIDDSAITALQPSRSWAPQIGLILASYF